MSFNKYYQDELVALRTMGREFARRNPGLAPFLATPGRDPDVERLLEGFAFLSGRLRQKLDDELPEITHALFNLLWPNYLRPVPSCSIVRYCPSEALSDTFTIPRGSKVEAKAVEDTNCVFSTVYDVDIAPLKLTGLNFQEREGRPLLALELKTLNNTLAGLSLDKLKFFLAGESSLATTLYYVLIKKLQHIKVCCLDNEGVDRPFMILEPNAVQPVGFAENQAMLPYPSNTFSGYRLLQEYFCFPEKFLFVELSGLNSFAESLPEKFKEKKTFHLQFWLDELPAEAELFQKDNLQLFCTPVVNLFSFDAAPLLIDNRQTEYRIVPDPRHPDHLAVYSVDKVNSWYHNAKSDLEYQPFESFEHSGGAGKVPAYYRLRVRPALSDDGTETYISIIHPEGVEAPASETISLELTCTNRFLPAKLALGDICLTTDNSPEQVDFRNITPVTGSYAPPLGGDLPWRLISNMSLNYIPLVNVQALKTVVSTYDFRALHDKKSARLLEQTLSGMIKVDSVTIDRIYRGLPLRGSRTFLTLNREAFNGEGAMYLFGALINEFLALYATVNSFHELVVVEEKCGEQYKWPARLGSNIQL